VADLRGLEILHADEIFPRPRHGLLPSFLDRAPRRCRGRLTLSGRGPVHRCLTLLGLLDDDAVLAVVLGEHHGHGLLAAGGQVLPDIVWADGQLAVSAIDEHGETNHAGPSEIHEGVHGRPDGPPREEHVVHEDDGDALEREGDLRAAHLRLLDAGTQVVPVEGDVEGPPPAGGWLASPAISGAMRGAGASPRVLMPPGGRWAPPACSTISWPMRVSARSSPAWSSTSAFSRNVTPLPLSSGERTG